MKILIKIFKISLMAFGALIIINMLYLSVTSKINFGIFTAFCAGLLLLLLGIFYYKIQQITRRGILKVLKIVVCIGLVFSLSVMCFLFYAGKKNTADYTEDAIIVLGNSINDSKPSKTLIYRLDAALEYAQKNENAIIVVAGGLGKREQLTEARVMADYLIQRGISENRILLEDKSTDTYENFKFSKIILDEYFDDEYKITFTTNEFHIYRSLKNAQRNGFECTYIGTKLGLDTIVSNYIREFAAVMRLWLLNK